MNAVTHYTLSDISELDVGDIYDYTLGSHGAAQAAVYLTGLPHTQHHKTNAGQTAFNGAACEHKGAR